MPRTKRINLRSPEKLLDELGITSPEHINVEVIAQYTGATVLYEPLSGCAGRILGRGDKAYITVDENSHFARQRFSAAHELGHWMRDREHVNSSFSCTAREMSSGWRKDGTNPERRANQFAADLLLPKRFFVPDAQGRDVTFDTVDELCPRYRTSLTATAIRLVEHSNLPAMILWFEIGGSSRWEWFQPGDLVPQIVWPRNLPGGGTNAHTLLNGGAEEAMPIEVNCAEWFTDKEASQHYVCEHSRRLGDRGVLSLLWWKDEEHLMKYHF